MIAKTQVLFLIPSLVAHGAERQLCELVKHMDPDLFGVHVVVFYDPGSYLGDGLEGELRGLPHVSLQSLHKRRGWPGYLAALARLLALTVRIKPCILHGYMDGNLPVLLLGRLMRKPVVWGIRRSSSALAKVDGRAQWLGRISTRLSRYVDLIIFNSEAGRSTHERIGIIGRRACVIPNGFDVDRFSPDASAGAAQRHAWGIAEGAPLIGIVGRLDPVKDHPTMLRAAARVLQEWPAATFVCVGSGPSDYTETLKSLAGMMGIADRVLWPGACDQMPAVYNALTLLVLSSTEEGFPNVIGEAMACGVPCIATRVGDAAQLIGDTGMTVGVADDAALADAACRLLREPSEERASRSRSARARICSLFSAEALARNTERSLLSLLPSASTQTARHLDEG